MTSRLKTRFSQKNLKKYLKKNKNLNQSKKIPKNTAKLKKTHKITSKKLGVDFITNFLVGKVKTIKELLNKSLCGEITIL